MSKLKKFSKNNRKKNFIIVTTFLLIGIILVGISYAVYQKEDEVLFINARVGEFETSSSDIELAIKVDGEEVEIPPTIEEKDNYTVIVECDHALGSWDNDRWGANIDNITSNRVKCNVSFTTQEPTLSEVTATSTKTSINLSYSTEKIVTNITCKYGTEKGNYENNVESATNTNCNITELEMDTTYYYQVCAKNNGGETCSEGNIKTRPLIDLGDYIKMTPTSTSYTLPNNLSGCTGTSSTCIQNAINPSELNIWRVIKKNDDGTVDMVSDKISSKTVYIGGATGFMNYPKALNTIAAQYTDGKHVERTRHVGYSNQKLTCNGPLNYSGFGDCVTDTGYQTDINLIQVAIGKVTAVTVSGTGNNNFYYVPSRAIVTKPAVRDGELCLVTSAGNIPCYGTVHAGTGDTWYEYYNYSVRPVVTLKSTIEVNSGDGTNNSPYTLK